MSLLRLRTLVLACVAGTVLGACGGGSDDDSTVVVPPPSTNNQAPSAQSNSASTQEDSPVTVDLSATDSDGTVASYEIVTPPQNGSLSGTGSRQTYTPNTNFNGSDSFAFRVTDNDGDVSNTAVITLVIEPENDAPVITSVSTVNISDNTSGTVYQVVATDIEQDTLSFEIDSGVDASLFSIDNTSGNVAFVSAPQFDNPQDADQDNVYELSLIASDGQTNSASLAIEITVTQRSQNLIGLIYPTPDANLGGISTTITALGTLNANAFQGNLSQDVANVEVNGVVATLSNSNQNWQADIPVTQGPVTIDIDVVLNDNSRITRQASAQNVITVGAAAGLALNGSNLYILDSTFDSLLSYNLVTNTLASVSNNRQQNGPSFVRPIHLSLDDTAQNAFVIDSTSDAILAVNLTSGERRLVSSNAMGSGPNLNQPRASVFNPDGGQLLVVDALARSIVAIDTSTGNRTIVSDTSTGSGDDFGLPFSIALDAVGNRALVTDLTRDALIAVDLATGNRTVLSDATVGNGVEFSFAQQLAFDSANNRAFVSDRDDEQIIEVDLASGNRTVLTSASLASNNFFTEPGVLLVDSTNNRLLVAEPETMVILGIALNDGSVSTVVRTQIGNGRPYDNPGAIELDLQNNRALIADVGLMSLLAMDLDTGDRTVISNGDVGAGDDFTSPFDLALDVNNNLAYLVDGISDAILSIDLDTGNRTVIVSSSDPMIDRINHLSFDGVNNRLVFVDAIRGRLFGYALATNTLTTLADANTGAGPEFNEAQALTVDATNQTAYILNLTDRPTELIAVDLTTGDRSLISDPSRGTGPNISSGSDMTLDRQGNRAVVLDGFERAVITVDLTTGDRTLISDNTNGEGTSLASPGHLAFHTENQTLLVTDSEVNAVFLIESSSGNRAIVSQ